MMKSFVPNDKLYYEYIKNIHSWIMMIIIHRFKKIQIWRIFILGVKLINFGRLFLSNGSGMK